MEASKKTQILVTWIGHTDLRAMAQDQPKGDLSEIIKAVQNINLQKGEVGPVKTLFEKIKFDDVFLLSNYPAKLNTLYQKWLKNDVTILSTSIKNPTDYKEIFVEAKSALSKITQKYKKGAYELSLFLSPGTPAMAAIWVLLGKSKYTAKFYQTYEGKAWETDIPFDLAMDYVPELLKDSDNIFQHLASKSPQEIAGFENIVGDSKAIRLAVGRAKKAAIRDVPVLLLGESGTGKEMFARAIHLAGRRSNKPFIPINCAAIPRELIESELFGHKKGAFTGANSDRNGAFKRADGGILFLDEVGECDPEIQAKLLRVLQPPLNEDPCVREFRPVGSEMHERSDVRVIAATNKNLIEAVENSKFREDLYYRLAVITIKLPPLRERTSDIEAIANSLLVRINKDFGAQEPGYKHKKLSVSANAFVKKYTWLGNVRQLHNVLLQAVAMSEKEIIEKEEIEAAISDVPRSRDKSDVLEYPLGEGFNLEKHLEEIQVHYLQRAMKEAGGVKTKAAELLDIKNYQTLDAQLKRLKVNWK